MGQYDEVNKEIQNLLLAKSARETTPPAPAPSTDILPLLEALHQTYSEIKQHLDARDADGLRDALLKSDVKMSLVCETLLDTLRTTVTEKNSLSAANNELSQQLRTLREQTAVDKVHRERLEQDFEARRHEHAELARLVRDQKERIEEHRREAQKARNEAALARARSEELEALRQRAADRIAVHDKELEALSNVLHEKDAEIQRLTAERRAEEMKNSDVKARAAEMEQEIAVLNRKLEAKERNLALCNNELSKLLCESKAARQEYEKNKEGSAYYQNLYRSLEKQNAYLNSQLSKMLKFNEGGAEALAASQKARRKARRYRKRARALEAELGGLRTQLAELKERRDDPDETAVLSSRVEELSTRNREYRDRIRALEAEKNAISQNIARLEREKSETLLRMRSKIREEAAADYRKTDYTKIGNDGGIRRAEQAAGSHVAKSGALSGYKPGENQRPDYTFNRITDFKPSGFTANPPNKYFGMLERSGLGISGAFQAGQRPSEPLFNSMRPPQLAHSYTDRPVLSATSGAAPLEGVVAGEFAGLNDSQLLREEAAPAAVPVAPLTGVAEPPLQAPPAAVPETLFSPPLGAPARAPPIPDTRTKQPPSQPANPRTSRTPLRDEPSGESIKTYHTTSTLKDMIARTSQLQKKFEALEEQLANIKEGDTAERLTEKVQTYSNNLSHWNAESGDSDFI